MEVRQAKESLMKSMVALELAQTKAQCLELDIEPLMLEHRRLSTDVSVLQEQNSNLHRTIEQTQMEKEHLENEIKQIRDSCAALEDRCTQTSTIRHNLETKLASRLLQSEGLQMQLQGAWQQIQSLEAQQEASIADRFDLEKQIKRLENDLIAAREECEDALCMLESEREEKMSAANALRKVESEAEDLHSQFKTISVSSDNLQMSADHSFKQVASYEAKISCLLKEKEKLENTISALTNKVENLKLCSDEAFISSKKEIDTLKGKICKLEEALVAADALSHEQSKCARDLDSEVKELTTTLYRRKRLADLSIPLAVIATGSLVVFGVMCIWRRNS
ncbi:hypothetical protein KP509_02G002500 [Ceratopteris richardii]|nr:hypothetical protein KP509_02G002500 [Ceratopteris richardii]